ncbi:nuclear transport factor 2 family protein [Solwaraspora sp. WMMD792]|uniref:nuclear transport factor 2 family protein n=1 Tax=Solwaraspora sp. WMMD792 TaxID=3016099 RepID=UPI002417DBB4|nr:nuclear transport factor 2 family protein [Solwaraspora sp. WMMD792]MDG4774640.1 nuclear transport factor 2 family protein [Solwaraspora sp. WMMD792]
MTEAPSPTVSPAAQLLHRCLDHLLAKDMPGFLAHWHDDAVAEFPFAPPGYPRRLDGIAAVTGYLIDYPKLIDIAEFPNVTVHQSVDPEVVIAELTATGTVVPTGQPYRMSYVVVVTVRDGRIAHYRDYWNPLAAPDLASAAPDPTAAAPDPTESAVGSDV